MLTKIALVAVLFLVQTYAGTVELCADEPNDAYVIVCEHAGTAVDLQLLVLDDDSVIPGWSVPIHTFEVAGPPNDITKVGCGSDWCYETCLANACNGTADFFEWVEGSPSVYNLEQYDGVYADGFVETCFCSLSYCAEKEKVQLLGIWYEVVSKYTIPGQMIFNTMPSPDEFNMHPEARRRREGDDAVPCQAFAVATLQSAYVQGIDEEDPAIWTMRVYKGENYDKVFDVKYGAVSVIFPDSIRRQSGTLTIQVFRNGVLCNTEKIEVIGVKPTVTHDCFFCAESYEDWKHLKPAQKASIVLAWALILALIITILNGWPKVLAFLWALFVGIVCLPRNTYRSIKSSQMSKDISDKASSTRKYMFGDPESGTEMLTKTTSGSKKMAPRNVGITSFTVVAFIALLPLVLAVPSLPTVDENTIVCSDGLTIPSTTENCIQIDEFIQECEVDTSILASLTVAGSSGCFTLVDVANQEFLAEVTITYDTLQQINTLSKLYYTAPWSNYIFSKDKCDDYKHCKASFGTEWLARNDPFYKGIISLSQTILNIFLNWPGETYFFRNDGGVTHGCPADPGDKCIYGASAIIPDISEIRKVYRINQPSLHPSFTINVTDATETKIAKLTYAGLPLSVLGLNFRYEGLLDTERFDHSQNGLVKVVEHENNNVMTHALIQAADQNVPQVGLVGDIQADTQAKMETAARNAFRFHPDLLEGHLVGYAVALVSPDPAINITTNYNYLPNVGTYGSAFVQGGSLRTNLTNSGAALVSLTSSQAFTVRRTSTTVCPEIISVIDVSGCFSCEDGVRAILRAKSTCLTGHAFVTTEAENITISSGSVLLYPGETDVVIYFHTSVQNNEFTVCLEFKTNKDCTKLKFIAVEAETVVDAPNKTGKMNHHKSGFEKPGSPGGFFTKTIAGIFESLFGWTGSWWEKIVAVIFCLFIIYVMVKILPVLAKKTATGAQRMRARMESMMPGSVKTKAG